MGAYTQSVSALVDEMHRAFIEATRLVASALPDAASAELGEWFVYEAGVENPDFNLAAVAGDAGRAALELEAVADWFAERRAGYRLKLRPTADRPVIAAARPAIDEHGRREPYLSLDLSRRATAEHEPCEADETGHASSFSYQFFLRIQPVTSRMSTEIHRPFMSRKTM